ncbi:MAG: Ldh family oxidoreductase [Alphaproteobacteria bacterium]|nr:Ldh family oxidoreductase [Alphaproteobacteria bacterium]MCB9930342.1 Ldh family oxidoreductase [Alphaproteobacteria bacterium]
MSAAAGETVTLKLDEVRPLTAAALRAAGADRANAEAVADVVTRAERDGCASHGVFRVPGYCAILQAGEAKGDARPRVERRAPGVVFVDGDKGLAPLPMALGRPMLAQVAREQGIAAMAIRNSAHFAALWPDVEPLAQQGLVAMSFVNSRAFVAPAGGTRPLYGTNPMSFACPRADGRPPMVWDQASSAAARGEIMIAARDGHSVPEGFGLGPDGQPTTDPNKVLEGVQLAFGGYKGAAIALMVEILAAGLSGGELSFEADEQYTGHGGPTHNGHLVIAMDPSAFGADTFLERVEGLFARILSDGDARLPGDRRLANRARIPKAGTVLPAALVAEVKAIAAG